MAKTTRTVPQSHGVRSTFQRTPRDDAELTAGWLACGRDEPCPFDASTEFRAGWMLRLAARKRPVPKAASASILLSARYPN